MLIAPPTTANDTSRAPLGAQPADVNPGRFVFGLWGDPGNPRFVGKIVPEFHRGAALAESLGALVYCTPATHRIVRNRFPTATLIPSESGSLWSQKLAILDHALQQADSVVWLDWDARQLAPLPDSFWRGMHARGPLQTKIRQYKRIKCPWRFTHKRTLCGGAFIYCRSRRLILRARRAMRWHPWDDEIAMAWVIDQHSGGWRGMRYYHQHYDPLWYTIRGEIFRPRRAIFTAR